jgi:hypothetical protein
MLTHKFLIVGMVWSSILGCGALVRTMTVGMVWSAIVFSNAGVVVMGTNRVSTLHPQGPGDLELPPAPEAAPPSLEESSRVVCKDGDPLCTIPMKIAPESLSLGERLRRPRWSMVNSKLPKRMGQNEWFRLE